MKVKQQPRGGFTLVELLVAGGITAVLATVMVSVVAQTAAGWARSANRMSGEAKARQVFEQLAADIAGMHGLDNGDCWFAADVHGTLDVATDNLEEARFGTNGVRVKFVTTRRGRNRDLESLSAPVAVGYRIVRRETGGIATYVLCRAEVRPATVLGAEGSTAGRGTLEAGYDVIAPAYDSGEAGSFADPGTLAASVTAGDSVLAEHVIDFGVRGEFPRPGGLGSNVFVYPPVPRPAGEAGDSGLPRSVDIMLRILTDEGARLVARLGTDAGMPVQDRWRLVQAHSHVFTRRLRVEGSP
jgi:hypothetical protein